MNKVRVRKPSRFVVIPRLRLFYPHPRIIMGGLFSAEKKWSAGAASGKIHPENITAGANITDGPKLASGSGGGIGTGTLSFVPSFFYHRNRPTIYAILPLIYLSVAVCLDRLFAWKVFRKDNYPRLTRLISRKISPSFPFSWVSFFAHYFNPWQSVDETVVLGCSPMLYGSLPSVLLLGGALSLRNSESGEVFFLKKLMAQEKISGMINMQDEWTLRKEVAKQVDLDLEQNILHLPTFDHHEPALPDLYSGVKMLVEYTAEKKRVYVHCKGGKGRSGAVVFCYLVWKQRRALAAMPEPARTAELQKMNVELGRKKKVRSGLWRQRNVQAFTKWACSNTTSSAKFSSLPDMPQQWITMSM
ncbi:unnamed protein product [Amoebophrya sp. A120]|nr:unnamed protein product [Amoebophrya sp. A120]|eukprot:GSA120T00001674001.1